MSKTLEEVILALPCDGATTLAIVGALKEAGLADATVYGLCETCGGSRVVPKPYGDDRDRGRTFSACPDCTTVSVVAKELRERADEAIVSILAEYNVGVGKPVRRVMLDAVLSTVLGKTRVAENILTVDGFVQHGGTTEFYDANAENPQPQDIAILEDDDG